MTLASEPSPPRTVVLLAGRARRLQIALDRLGVRLPQVEPEPAGTPNLPDEPGDIAPPPAAAEEPAAPEPVEITDIGEFHEQVLEAAKVRGDDARPQAVADVAAAVTPEHEAALTAWLQRQLADTDTLLVDERRLSWLLPVWVRACVASNVRVGVVLPVRRPDLSADPQVGAPSRGRPGDIARAASWLNHVLFTERATRDLPTVVMPIAEVVDDWVAATARIADALDLAVIRDASATTIRGAQQALDQAPGTLVEPAEQVALPARLRQQVDDVWALLERRAGGAGEDEKLQLAFDEARATFAAYYLEAEAVSRSSARALVARRGAGKRPPEPPAEPPPAEPPAPRQRRRWWRPG